MSEHPDHLDDVNDLDEQDDVMKILTNAADPAVLERVRADPDLLRSVLETARAVAYGVSIEAGKASIPPEIAARLDRQAWVAFHSRNTPDAEYAEVLAAQSAAAVAPLPAGAVFGQEQGIHALFVDHKLNLGHVRPLLARLIPAEKFDMIPRVQCDPVMRAAAVRAAKSAIDELVAAGFDPPGPGQAIEWWIEGDRAAYEGASIGLAVALVTVAVVTGISIDPGTVVSGAVDRGKVLPVSGVAAKYAEVTRTGFDRLMLPADSRGDLPADASYARSPRLSLVSSVREAIDATLGAALGLTAPRLAALAGPDVPFNLQLDLWVELAAGQSAVNTRAISMEPATPLSRWIVGDTLRIGVRASADCHVALINVGPTGNVTVLSPSTLRPDLSVNAGQTLFFPTPADNFQFTLKGPPGRERLIAIATAGPIHQALPLLARAAGGDRTVDLLAVLADPAILSRAAADFIVDPAPHAAEIRTRGMSPTATSSKSVWRSFDF